MNNWFRLQIVLILFASFFTVVFAHEPFCISKVLGTTNQVEQLQTFDALNEQMRYLQKNELHLHIGGAWPLHYLEKVSTPEEFKELSWMLDQIQENEVNYHDIFRIFTKISQIMNSDERIENGIVALCQNLLSDNVIYAEFRTGIKDLGSGLEDYLQSVLRGIKKGTESTPLKVGLILSLRRNTDSFLAEQSVDLALKYRDQGVVGLDLSGDSTIGDVTAIFPALLRAKENHLPITVHIGESKEETSKQQMLELLTLQPERIGHGVHLCEEGIKWIKEKKVLVELCLTSAVKTGMISDPNEHPALSLLMQGHPVAICTDDPLVFNTTLSQEFTKVALLTGLLPEEIQELQKEVQTYRFCN